MTTHKAKRVKTPKSHRAHDDEQDNDDDDDDDEDTSDSERDFGKSSYGKLNEIQKYRLTQFANNFVFPRAKYWYGASMIAKVLQCAGVGKAVKEFRKSNCYMPNTRTFMKVFRKKRVEDCSDQEKLVCFWYATTGLAGVSSAWKQECKKTITDSPRVLSEVITTNDEAFLIRIVELYGARWEEQALEEEGTDVDGDKEEEDDETDKKGFRKKKKSAGLDKRLDELYKHFEDTRKKGTSTGTTGAEDLVLHWDNAVNQFVSDRNSNSKRSKARKKPSPHEVDECPNDFCF